jgi:hypothetical protein
MTKIEIRKKKIINKNYAEDAVVCQNHVKIKKIGVSLSSQERNPIIFFSSRCLRQTPSSPVQ